MQHQGISAPVPHSSRCATHRRGGLADDHPASVTTTWSLAFVLVERANPAAADLLRFCAFLHPDAIPEDLLRQGATQTESPLQAIGTDDLAFHEALRTLGAYLLLRRDLTSRMLSTHRLVQAVLIDAMTPGENPGVGPARYLLRAHCAADIH